MRTTVADPAHAPASNVVARDCTAPALNRSWPGASTSAATHEGWPDLAVLRDARARRVVGRATADHPRTAPARDALAMAQQARRPPPGPVHHADRGRRYTAAACRAGACLANAMAGRCCATRTAEVAYARVRPSRAAARTAIFARIAIRSNRQRRHAALN